MNLALKRKMTVAEFLEWAEAQPEGDFELVDGQIVAMVQERALHNLAKMAVARALQDAVAAAGLDCTVYTDGMTVEIDTHTARGPDALVQCGTPVDFDSMIVQDPLIAVEVVSPSSERRDTDAKLVDYFSLPSIRHYLIFFPQKGAVVHHAKDDRGGIATNILHSGTIRLDPPGMDLPLEDVLSVGRDLG
jgi:Uma2 family endonuclease